MKKTTRTDAYRSFGVKLKNPQWSRSGRSSDGKTVVVSLWQDRLIFKDKACYYVHSPEDGWFKSPGQSELLENLKWSIEHCAGRFKVVLVSARDIFELPRRVASSDPVYTYEMEITHFDVSDGSFKSRGIPL